MNDYNKVHNLVNWIESRLDTPISVSMVACEAGCSTWSLQRLFKRITGKSLYNYIHCRRLSVAAVELRLTDLPVMDIALSHNFSSSQSFTRSFYQYFKLTPREYRNNDEWDCGLLFPPFVHPLPSITKPTIVNISRYYFEGKRHTCKCEFQKLSFFDMEIRSRFWLRHFGQVVTSSKCIFSLSYISPGCDKSSEFEVVYCTSKKDSFHSDKGSDGRILVNGGEYLKFDYFGDVKDFHLFITNINKYYLPKLKVVRRKCFDVEIYHLSNVRKASFLASVTSCSYLIPCSNTHQLNLLNGGGVKNLNLRACQRNQFI